jgi:hypothetical protein
MGAAEAPILIGGHDIRLVSFWLSLASLLAAAASVTFAYFNSKKSADDKAKDIYRAYLKLAFDNPHLAGYEKVDISGFSQEDKTRYRYFLALTLNAIEEILYVSKNDPAWRRTVTRQAKKHVDYLEAMDTDRCAMYSKEVRSLIRGIAKGNW